MKFKYINSNEEEAQFEAIPLTSEIYKSLIEDDIRFLTDVSKGLNEKYTEAEFITAASDMLNTFGNDKEFGAPINSDLNFLAVIHSKTIIKEAKSSKKISLTSKKILRSELQTGKIRAFKKEKMSEIQDLAN